MLSDTNKPSIKILFLFTYSMSLERWKKQGLLNREVQFFQKMMTNGIKQVYFLTYGSRDSQYADEVYPCTILPRRIIKRYDLLYGLLTPFIHWSIFKSSDVIRSNQVQGAWIGTIAKIIMPKKRFILRCGWIPTEEMMRKDWHYDKPHIWASNIVQRLSFSSADMIFVTSSKDRDYVCNKFSIQEKKIWIIPNQVDTDVFSPHQTASNRQPPFCIISVGRHVEMKNFQSIILAIQKSEVCNQLTLIGDGPYKETLIKLAGAQNQRPITFLPFSPNNEIAQHLQRADIFILPEFYGSGISKAILEAMSVGLIVIASDIQSHREIVTDGINGFLCKPDPTSIFECLEKIANTKQETLLQISKRARKDVLERYSTQVILDKEYQLILENHFSHDRK